jgi:hypothetical protein
LRLAIGRPVEISGFTDSVSSGPRRREQTFQVLS